MVIILSQNQKFGQYFVNANHIMGIMYMVIFFTFEFFMLLMQCKSSLLFELDQEKETDQIITLYCMDTVSWITN